MLAKHETQTDWLKSQIENLTDYIPFLPPSEWVSENRYLPPGTTPFPGYFDWNVTPYLKEILDCLSPMSPIRIVDVMKGVQLGFTVGILENYIGYLMAHIKTSPVMFLTADGDMAKNRMETNIIPMMQYCGLQSLIRSTDTTSKRKSGKTDAKIEWDGGGYLMPMGAYNANKFRQFSFEVALLDECDGYKASVGNQGKPGKLAVDRTAAYEQTRKILRISTPLLEETSMIWSEAKQGDQRVFKVPCKHCGERQKLSFYGVNKGDATVYGLDYELIGDQELEEGSARYICKFCQGEMINDDKLSMLKGGLWEPTVRSTWKYRRSYQLSSLYSPPGMQSWDELIRKRLECWDIKKNRPRDIDLLQQFSNNVLGVPFKARANELKFAKVIEHRRNDYASGFIPNKLSEKETGHKIQLLTCAVDVHKRHLDVHVIGWLRGRGFYSIDWFKWEGDILNLNSDPWEKLRELILDKIYTSDTGEKYRPQLTLIDSGYQPDLVYDFCNEFSVGVHPILGRQEIGSSKNIQHFTQFTSKLGIPAFNINNSIYKDRLMTSLTRDWDYIGFQPLGYANFPGDYPDNFFNELTVEQKRKKINPITNQVSGYYWYKPVNAENHAWDLSVYASAALDMLMIEICTETLGLEQIDPKAFWDYCEEANPFTEISLVA